jgi:hypothetical protein
MCLRALVCVCVRVRVRGLRGLDIHGLGTLNMGSDDDIFALNKGCAAHERGGVDRWREQTSGCARRARAVRQGPHHRMGGRRGTVEPVAVRWKEHRCSRAPCILQSTTQVRGSLEGTSMRPRSVHPSKHYSSKRGSTSFEVSPFEFGIFYSSK